jgi:16S rRNA C1402 N4-methylase RsmH
MPENFEATFEKIKEKYAAKCRISIVPFHGFTTNAFKNFLEGNDISNCFVPKNLEYKMGVNPVKFITKSKLTTI